MFVRRLPEFSLDDVWLFAFFGACFFNSPNDPYPSPDMRPILDYTGILRNSATSPMRTAKTGTDIAERIDTTPQEAGRLPRRQVGDPGTVEFSKWFD
jgi:hypothetical protein